MERKIAANFIDDICCDCGAAFRRSTLSRSKRCQKCQYEKKKTAARERYNRKKSDPAFLERERERKRKRTRRVPLDTDGMQICPRMHVRAKDLPCGKREECFGKKKCQHLPPGIKKLVREFVKYGR